MTSRERDVQVARLQYAAEKVRSNAEYDIANVMSSAAASANAKAAKYNFMASVVSTMGNVASNAVGNYYQWKLQETQNNLNMAKMQYDFKVQEHQMLLAEKQFELDSNIKSAQLEDYKLQSQMKRGQIEGIKIHQQMMPELIRLNTAISTGSMTKDQLATAKKEFDTNFSKAAANKELYIMPAEYNEAYASLAQGTEKHGAIEVNGNNVSVDKALAVVEGSKNMLDKVEYLSALQKEKYNLSMDAQSRVDSASTNYLAEAEANNPKAALLFLKSVAARNPAVSGLIDTELEEQGINNSYSVPEQIKVYKSYLGIGAEGVDGVTTGAGKPTGVATTGTVKPVTEPLMVKPFSSTERTALIAAGDIAVADAETGKAAKRVEYAQSLYVKDPKSSQYKDSLKVLLDSDYKNEKLISNAWKMYGLDAEENDKWDSVPGKMFGTKNLGLGGPTESALLKQESLNATVASTFYIWKNETDKILRREEYAKPNTERGQPLSEESYKMLTSRFEELARLRDAKMREEKAFNTPKSYEMFGKTDREFVRYLESSKKQVENAFKAGTVKTPETKTPEIPAQVPGIPAG